MNGFTKKRIGTMTLAEKLKKLRSERRLSLNEISRNTGIQAKYIENLEEGNFEELPADVYVKGFLRNYANYLGVDEKVFLKAFEKEKTIHKNIKEKDKPEKNKNFIKPLQIKSFSFTPKKIITTFILIAFVAITFFIYQEVGSFASTPRLVITSPKHDSQVDGNSVSIEGITEKDAKLFVNDQPIFVNDEGRFNENVMLQPGNNVINIVAINQFDKRSQESIIVKSNYENKQFEEEPETDPIEEALNEIIRLDIKVSPGPVWLNIESDGKLVFSGTMLEGATQKFEAQEKIIISSGKGNSTFLSVNGAEAKPLSEDPGAIKEVIIDKNSIGSFEN